MPWVNKEDLTVRELKTLCPTHGLFDGVNYDKVEFFKDDKGKLYEISWSLDGSLTERMNTLKKNTKD